MIFEGGKESWEDDSWWPGEKMPKDYQFMVAVLAWMGVIAFFLWLIFR